jgi:hypothetical protein
LAGIFAIDSDESGRLRTGRLAEAVRFDAMVLTSLIINDLYLFAQAGLYQSVVPHIVSLACPVYADCVRCDAVGAAFSVSM